MRLIPSHHLFHFKKSSIYYYALYFFVTLIFILVLNKNLTAQNLCPNNSFENFIACPSALSQLSSAISWGDAPGSSTTSDLFNACHINSFPLNCQDVGVPQNFAGSAPAHTGNGYAGIIAYYGVLLREYAQAQLDSSLDPGVAYRLEVYIRKSGLCRYAIDKIGILISAGSISQPGSANIPIAPQLETSSLISDTSNWTLLTGIYIASGGEDHITIGNFRDNGGTNVVDMGLQGTGCLLNNSSAYYYIDDVKVERINERVIIVGDTLICPGGSKTLFANTNVTTWWSTGALPNDTLSTASSVTVSPTVTTTYILNGLLIKDSVTIYIVPPPVVNLGNDTTICEGFSVLLDATNPDALYTWSTGESSPVIHANQDQLYWVIADNGGCTAGDSMNLTVLSNPPVDLGSDSVFCVNDHEFLVLDAGTGTGYLWQPTGDTTRTVAVHDEITYMVTVNHANGCTTSAGITTIELCPVLAFIPQAFTPNEDGRNDVFLPFVTNGLSYELKIFNRWGTLLFVTDNPAVGWNGTFKNTKAPSGSYVYVIRYSSVTESQRLEKKTIRGNVLLVR